MSTDQPVIGPERSRTTCAQHTSAPTGYLAWHEWAKNKAKTHDTFQCDECGLWKIWRRRDRGVAA